MQIVFSWISLLFNEEFNFKIFLKNLKLLGQSFHQK